MEFDAEGVPLETETSPTPPSTPTDSDGLLTEAAGREEAAGKRRAEAADAALADDVPWESDTNRADLKSSGVVSRGPRYDPYQLLALAVQLGVAGETPDATIQRATAYEKWIQDDQRN